MAKTNEAPKDPQTQESAPNLEAINVSGGDLLKLIALLQKDNAQVLADALSKLQPGYQSPEQKQFQEQLRQDQRNIQIATLRAKKRSQRFCEHEVGQTGRHRNGEGAFCGLKLPTGEVIGVCQYCQMVISSSNPEHARYFRKLNGTVAEAGQAEGILDPVKAQLARLSPDQRAKVLASRAEFFASESSKEPTNDDDLI